MPYKKIKKGRGNCVSCGNNRVVPVPTALPHGFEHRVRQLLLEILFSRYCNRTDIEYYNRASNRQRQIMFRELSQTLLDHIGEDEFYNLLDRISQEAIDGLNQDAQDALPQGHVIHETRIVIPSEFSDLSNISDEPRQLPRAVYIRDAQPTDGTGLHSKLRKLHWY